MVDHHTYSRHGQSQLAEQRDCVPFEIVGNNFSGCVDSIRMCCLQKDEIRACTVGTHVPEPVIDSLMLDRNGIYDHVVISIDWRTVESR